jgi:ABC-type multidrug transport system fused ATPase/permease subunit
VLQGAVVASHRIFKALDLPILITTPDNPLKKGRAEGRIEFENVWFAYNDEEWVLKDVSFVVHPGQSVALVGHTGSGKTTITNLLMRFYDVERGILLDGVDVAIGICSHCARIRSRLAGHLLFTARSKQHSAGREDISDERVYWAATEVRADDFIRRLPQDTNLKERGAGLSVGQLLIFRAGAGL